MSGYVLRPSVSLTQVYLYRQPIDFRKSYRGLAILIEQQLGHNPFSGQLYVFINRHRNRLKCLFWEETGFVLYYKALAEEKFHWPKESQTLLTVSGQQLNWLLDGYPIWQLQGHKKLHYESVN